MDYRLDPVKRMFHDLAEADGEVQVRYCPQGKPEQATERTMRYRQYQRWLAQAPSNGFQVLGVETTKKPTG